MNNRLGLSWNAAGVVPQMTAYEIVSIFIGILALLMSLRTFLSLNSEHPLYYIVVNWVAKWYNPICKLRFFWRKGMEYLTATVEMADAIHNILHTTIRTVYPKYYPKEVVDFFCRHHSREHILEGIIWITKWC